MVRRRTPWLQALCVPGKHGGCGHDSARGRRPCQGETSSFVARRRLLSQDAVVR